MTSTTSWPRIVAFHGAAGAGKSSAADHLVFEHGYRRLKFAEPIKDMLSAMGLDELELEGCLKERPTIFGTTPRVMMQTLGTEWGRQMIHPNIWVMLMEKKIEELEFFDLEQRIVIDDLRFENELALMLRLDAAVIKVRRPGRTADAHVSEAGLSFSQRILTNDGSKEQLTHRLEHLLNTL